MSKIYEEIKEIDENLKEEALEEIDVLIDSKERKDRNFLKILLFIILLVVSIFSGYYLAGLILNKQSIPNVRNYQSSAQVNKKDMLKQETVVEFSIININKKEVENKLKELLNTDKKDNIINNNITLLLCELGNFKEALNYAEKLILSEPNNPYYWNTFGIVLTNLNLLDDAERSFRKAISLKSDEGVFYYNLGNLYEREGKIDLAKEQYLNYLAKGDKYNNQNIDTVKKKIARGF